MEDITNRIPKNIEGLVLASMNNLTVNLKTAHTGILYIHISEKRIRKVKKFAKIHASIIYDNYV